ncbi:MAG: MFS transporter [Anaerolineales bacterium]
MNRNLGFLFAALVLWGIGEGMFFYFQPLYLQQLGADPLTIGAILGGFGLMMTVAHIPAGFVADRIGRRPVLRAAWLTGTLAAWIMALSTSINVFIVGLLLYGLTAFVSAPLTSYVTAARGSLSVGRALTLMSAMFNVGMVFGPVLGGLVGDRLGLKTIYLIAAGLFVLSSAALFFLRPQPRDHHDPHDPPPGLLNNGRFLGFVGLSFAVMFALYMAQPLTPNFLQNERGMSLAVIGLIGSVGGLGNAFLLFTLGNLAPRAGYMIAQALVALFALIIWQGHAAWMYAGAYFLLGGFRVARVLGSAQARTLVHPSQMGIAFGILETINTLPGILAPPLAGFLYERDPALIYPLTMVVIALTLALTALFAPRQAARHAEISPEEPAHA